MSLPAAVQAATLCADPRNHFSSWTLTPGNGQLTIQWVTDIPNLNNGNGADNKMSFLLAEEEIEDAESMSASDLNDENEGGYEWAGYGSGNPTGSTTITELTNGTTYYVYAQIYITRNAGGEYVYGKTEDLHTLLLVGHVTPDASLSNNPVVSSGSSSSGGASSGSSSASTWTSYEETVASQIEAAPSGSTVVMENGISALSNSTMKELLAKGDVSLRMEFTYQDKEYVIIIPAGAALDNDIPWYGPLYLAQHFGNSAGSAGSEAGVSYEVKSGDTLSRIAAASNMTLQQLLAKNPQIKDANKISVGQKINR